MAAKSLKIDSLDLDLENPRIILASDQRDAMQKIPITRWHEQIGDPTLADGILDRLVHNAHRIEMKGDSMRKNRGKPGQ